LHSKRRWCVLENIIQINRVLDFIQEVKDRARVALDRVKAAAQFFAAKCFGRAANQAGGDAALDRWPDFFFFHSLVVVSALFAESTCPD